jgi:hypothetical protein
VRVPPAVGAGDAELSLGDGVALPRLVALVEGCLKGGRVGLDARRRKDQLLVRVDGGDAPDTTRSVPCGLLEADAGDEAGAGLGDSDGVLADSRDPPGGGAEAAAQALQDDVSGVEPPGDVPCVSRALQAVGGARSARRRPRRPPAAAWAVPGPSAGSGGDQKGAPSDERSVASANW